MHVISCHFTQPGLHDEVQDLSLSPVYDLMIFKNAIWVALVSANWCQELIILNFFHRVPLHSSNHPNSVFVLKFESLLIVVFDSFLNIFDGCLEFADVVHFQYVAYLHVAIGLNGNSERHSVMTKHFG
jgi:hypothetical protein